ncbi:MAG: hypothetical protein R6W78_09140 [Bacteroidales bacterium]
MTLMILTALTIPLITIAQPIADSTITPPIEIKKGGPTPKVGDIWVSPNGNDANSGTKESPLLSLQLAIDKAKPDVTIWMTEGVHKFTETVIIQRSLDGTSSKPYRICGIPGGSRPILDFTGVNHSSEIRGIQLDADYWHLRYLEIFGAADNGLNVNGSYNTLELLALHDNGDTGLQINSTNSLTPSYNIVLNCDSYMNADNSAEDADGFAAKLIIGPGNSFEGCRAWYNCDDNWDFYDAQSIVTLKGCWSIAAKHPTKSKTNSDGNGFKLGGIRAITSSWNKRGNFSSYEEYLVANTTPHVLEYCFAFGNPSRGFHRNNNPSTEITCTNCGAWNNKGGDFGDGIQKAGEVFSYPTITPAIAIAAKRDSIGNLPDIRTLIPEIHTDALIYTAQDAILTVNKINDSYLIRFSTNLTTSSLPELLIFSIDGKLVSYCKYFENEFVWKPENNLRGGQYLIVLKLSDRSSILTKKVFLQ